MMKPDIQLYSIEAEQALLGGIMLNPEAFDDVADIVSEDDMWLLSHRLIWRSIAGMVEAQEGLDVISIGDKMDRAGILDDAGGFEYIGTITANVAGSKNVKRYAGLVSNYARERRVMQALHGSVETMQQNGDTEEKLEQVVTSIQSAAEIKQKGGGPVRAGDLVHSWMSKLEERNEQQGGLTGLETPWDELNRITGGLQAGDLVVLAGRPSMGKSTVAQNIAEHVSVKLNIPTLFFSLEMPSSQILDRAAASIGNIYGSLIKSGNLDDSDWPRLSSATIAVSNAPLYIDDASRLTPTELRARARRINRKEKLGLVVVDYLQLMHVPGYKNDKVHEVEEISRSLKGLAKELKVPVIALSQLNRAVDARADKRPIMSDLRESGAIEQDADIVAFIYRADQYRTHDEPRDNIAELIIRKHRNGETGTVFLESKLQYLRFDNHDGRGQIPLGQPREQKGKKPKGFD